MDHRYMNFDFTGEGKYELVNEGQQTVVVEDVTMETSKNGNSMVLFKLRAKNGGLLYHYCLNEEKKRWMLKKTLEAVTGECQPSGKVMIDLDQILGNALKVNVIHEEYNGITRAKVEDVVISEQVSPGQTKIDEFESGEVLGENAPF